MSLRRFQCRACTEYFLSAHGRFNHELRAHGRRYLDYKGMKTEYVEGTWGNVQRGLERPMRTIRDPNAPIPTPSATVPSNGIPAQTPTTGTFTPLLMGVKATPHRKPRIAFCCYCGLCVAELLAIVPELRFCPSCGQQMPDLSALTSAPVSAPGNGASKSIEWIRHESVV